MKKKEKCFKEKCIEEDIEFLRYLNYDLHIKFWCKPSKVILIDAMIKDTIEQLVREKNKINRRLSNDRR